MDGISADSRRATRDSRVSTENRPTDGRPHLVVASPFARVARSRRPRARRRRFASVDAGGGDWAQRPVVTHGTGRDSCTQRGTRWLAGLGKGMFSGAVSGTESPPRASRDDGDAETNALERTNGSPLSSSFDFFRHVRARPAPGTLATNHRRRGPTSTRAVARAPRFPVRRRDVRAKDVV